MLLPPAAIVAAAAAAAAAATLVRRRRRQRRRRSSTSSSSSSSGSSDDDQRHAAAVSELLAHPAAAVAPLLAGPQLLAPPPALSATPLVWVASRRALRRMRRELLSAAPAPTRVVGLDVEFNALRSYHGRVCLIQLSTHGGKDYLVDALALPAAALTAALQAVLRDPRVVKVLHGGGNDALWLRGLGLRLVNVFDTERAAAALGRHERGLAAVLAAYAAAPPPLPPPPLSISGAAGGGDGADDDSSSSRHRTPPHTPPPPPLLPGKAAAIALSDWRVRPLPPELVEYARGDARYLPHLAARLAAELQARSPPSDGLIGATPGPLLSSVVAKSNALALRPRRPAPRHDGAVAAALSALLRRHAQAEAARAAQAAVADRAFGGDSGEGVIAGVRGLPVVATAAEAAQAAGAAAAAEAAAAAAAGQAAEPRPQKEQPQPPPPFRVRAARLAAWRDAAARRADEGLQFVLPDAALLELAASSPPATQACLLAVVDGHVAGLNAAQRGPCPQRYEVSRAVRRGAGQLLALMAAPPSCASSTGSTSSSSSRRPAAVAAAIAAGDAALTAIAFGGGGGGSRGASPSSAAAAAAEPSYHASTAAACYAALVADAAASSADAAAGGACGGTTGAGRLPFASALDPSFGGGGGGGLRALRRRRDDPELRARLVSKFSAKRSVYDNAVMLSASGQLLCYLDQAKLNWYVNRGLAERVRDEPPTIRLLFAHTNANQQDSTFYSSSRENRCVVCGTDEHFLRHRVVPACYRRCFPPRFKSHRSHDVLLVCLDCQPLAQRAAERTKRALAAEYGVPLAPPAPTAADGGGGGDDDQGSGGGGGERERSAAAKARAAAVALLRHGSAIPPARRAALEAAVASFIGRPPPQQQQPEQFNEEAAPALAPPPQPMPLTEADLRAALVAGLSPAVRERTLKKVRQQQGRQQQKQQQQGEEGQQPESSSSAAPGGGCDDDGDASADDGADNADAEDATTTAAAAAAAAAAARTEPKGHLWHGQRVVAAVLAREGEPGLQLLIQAFRRAFFEACRPRHLPLGWAVENVDGRREFGAFSVYSSSRVQPGDGDGATGAADADAAAGGDATAPPQLLPQPPPQPQLGGGRDERQGGGGGRREGGLSKGGKGLFGGAGAVSRAGQPALAAA